METHEDGDIANLPKGFHGSRSGALQGGLRHFDRVMCTTTGDGMLPCCHALKSSDTALQRSYSHYHGMQRPSN